jgi:hypothetical protein
MKLSKSTKSVLYPFFNAAQKAFALVAYLVDAIRKPPPKLVLVEDDEGKTKTMEIQRRLEYYSPTTRWDEVQRSHSLSFLDFFSRRPVLLAGASNWPRLLLKLRQNSFNVDYVRHYEDAWEWSRLSQWMSHGKGTSSPDRLRDSRKAFQQYVRTIRSDNHDRCYLFGTGKSLAKAMDEDFSDGYRIVCNTIVRDKELWDHLSPHIIVAGDAIYHFGQTAHAAAFRRDLLLRLLEPGSKTIFLYPEFFDSIVLREFAAVRERLVAVPFGRHQDVTIDLCKTFQLPAQGNVLANMLLPLGCTLSKNVYLWGFDGRAPDDKNFWSNSSKHSYPELMPALEVEHPAFFEKHVPKARPQDYVQKVHGDELDQKLTVAENKGWRFIMLHETWTQTFKKRIGHKNGRAS